MSKLSKALIAAAGNSGGAGLTVEDVFSTYLYTGNNTTQTIDNGIDLNGEGGLMWAKARTNAYNNFLFDTERGVGKYLLSDSTAAEGDLGGSYGLYANTSGTGFVINGGGNGYNDGDAPTDYTSWTFRKAEKFFDVVTYTGDGVAGRTVAHNLGSVPGCIIVKRTNSSGSDWWVFHKGGTPNNYTRLNLSNAETSGTIIFNDTAPTESVFTVGTSSATNGSGNTYVAYLFASDAGGFGDDGSESIIKCGSFAGVNSPSNVTVNLGWEPQWVLVKVASGDTNSWLLFDNMRGVPTGITDAFLKPDSSNAEGTSTTLNYIDFNATGFTVTGDFQGMASGRTFIYIAIRRPMKTPESGTEVFAIAKSDGTSVPSFNAGFPIDTALLKATTVSNGSLRSRLTGTGFLETNGTGAEGSNSFTQWDYQDSWYDDNISSSYYSWMFKRATGFFDVVAYAGTDDNPQVVSHNLGVAPEMMLIKNRKDSSHWACYHSGFGATRYMFFETSNALETRSGTSIWDDTAPTDTQFTVSKWQTDGGNVSGYDAVYKDFIAYLFASLDGVSKVFSVTKSSGSNANVDCGFSAGARFILLKRTDSTGDWYVWDSVRGIVSGNDPYLLLNSTAAEVTTTDYIDPLASGFTIVDGGLANGDYIGLAIA